MVILPLTPFVLLPLARMRNVDPAPDNVAPFTNRTLVPAPMKLANTPPVPPAEAVKVALLDTPFLMTIGVHLQTCLRFCYIDCGQRQRVIRYVGEEDSLRGGGCNGKSQSHDAGCTILNHDRIGAGSYGARNGSQADAGTVDCKGGAGLS